MNRLVANENQKHLIEKCCIIICSNKNEEDIFIKTLAELSPDVTCLSASSALDALYIMTEEDITPDFIFIDYRLPNMGAAEFLKSIKNIDYLSSIPVVVHSIGADPNEVIKLKELGAFALYFREYDHSGVEGMLHFLL